MSEGAVRKALSDYGVTDPSAADWETLAAVIDLAVTIDVLDGHWVDPPAISPVEQDLINDARREEAAANLEVIHLQQHLAESRKTAAEAEEERLRPLLDAWQKNQGIRHSGNASLKVVHDDDGKPASLQVRNPNAPASDSVEDILAAWRATYGMPTDPRGNAL